MQDGSNVHDEIRSETRIDITNVQDDDGLDIQSQESGEEDEWIVLGTKNQQFENRSRKLLLTPNTKVTDPRLLWSYEILRMRQTSTVLVPSSSRCVFEFSVSRNVSEIL